MRSPALAECSACTGSSRRQALNFGLAAAASLSSPPAFASDLKYPTQPIRLIVPRTAGGVVDIIARQWGNIAGGLLGGNIVIENVAGGGGTIGSMQAARAPGDGHTLVMGSTSDLVLNPIIKPSLGYDPVKDFTPISIMAVTVCTIAVNPSLPITSLKELDRLRQGQSWQAVLWIGRRREHGQPCRRAVQATGRNA